MWAATTVRVEWHLFENPTDTLVALMAMLELYMYCLSPHNSCEMGIIIIITLFQEC